MRAAALDAVAEPTLASRDVNPLQWPSASAPLDFAMAEPTKNCNEVTPWSEVDIFNLKTSLELGHSVATIADFLMRREDEVPRKAIVLGVLTPARKERR